MVRPTSVPTPDPTASQHLPLIEDLKERRSSGRSIASANLFVTYEQNFGNLPPKVMEELHNWCDVLGEGIVNEAVVLAVKQGGKTFRYVETTLQRWKDAGVRTLEDVENYIKQHKKQKAIGFEKQTKQESVFDRLRREGSSV